MSQPAAHGRTFDRTIVEGGLRSVVWRLAWPTMVQNIIGGLQGIIDQAMVGNYVGYIGNAAVGASLQIFILVIVFVASVFTGMGVLVARFAGAGDSDKVNRTVYQALLVTFVLAFGLLAPIGYTAAPSLLALINAAPEVQAEALPFIRILFVSSIGMLLFFMFSGALRAAGDAKTPMRLGILMTVLNILFNIILIPRLGTPGAAIGTALASGGVGAIFIWLLFSNRLVVHFSKSMSFRPDWNIIRSLFRFGLPAGVQGIVMNLGGLLMFRFIGSLPESAEAQAAYAVGYTELFSLVTWTSVGLMGAAAAVAGQNLGAGRPDRSMRAVHVAATIGLGVAGTIGVLFLVIPELLLAIFGMTEGRVVAIGRQLLAYLAVSGLFVTVALTYTGGLQGTGDTKGPLYISLASQVAVPVGLCAVLQLTRGLQASDIWTAIVLGHFTRGALSVLRFRRGRWSEIRVDIGDTSLEGSMKRGAKLTLVAGALIAAAAVTSAQGQSAFKPHPSTQEPKRLVTIEKLRQWEKELSNWGRWGKDDERGLLNLITPEKTKAALALVKEGKTVTLQINPIKKQGSDTGGFGENVHRMWQLDPVTGAARSAIDIIQLSLHDGLNSHMDALCHYQGPIGRKPGEPAVSYNGHAFNLTAIGCTKSAVDRMGPGYITRGVLVDMPLLRKVKWLEPSTPIYIEDLEEWERFAGITIGPGDALLIRGGRWAKRAAEGPWPYGQAGAGLHASVMPWLRARDVSLLVSDAVNDVQPSGVAGINRPVHQLTQVNLGLPIVDNGYLEDAAREAERLKRWEFMLTLHIFQIQGGTAAPFNALATF